MSRKPCSHFLGIRGFERALCMNSPLATFPETRCLLHFSHLTLAPFCSGPQPVWSLRIGVLFAPAGFVSTCPRLSVSFISLLTLSPFCSAPTRLRPSPRYLDLSRLAFSSQSTLSNPGLLDSHFPPTMRQRPHPLYLIARGPDFLLRDFHCHMRWDSLSLGSLAVEDLLLHPCSFHSLSFPTRDISRSPPRGLFLRFYLSIL
jgi:hypothetical protein